MSRNETGVSPPTRRCRWLQEPETLSDADTRDHQEQRRRRVKKVAQRVSAGKGSIMMTSAGGAAQACRAVQRPSNLCRPSGAGTVFCALPRAYALPGSPTRAVFARWGGLGYLLEAPPALRYFAHGDMDRLDSHVEFLKRA